MRRIDMGKVQLLPDKVANQIAAGEVVERPASVVKELVENSLDAGATQIEIEIQAGGRNLIKVSDNGCGMHKDDALMSLERHATSKLSLASDLIELSSFGFRGEAIPSIASVSLFQLTTCVTDENQSSTKTGTQIIVDGGKIASVKDAGHPVGTSIEVRQLFFNVPVRKKFLKSIATEKAHIQEYVLLVALSHPEVSFTYIQDHKVIYRLPKIPTGNSIPKKIASLRKRWGQFRDSSRDLIEVYYEGAMPLSHPNEFSATDENSNKNSWLVVWGLIGKPGVSRSTRADQHIFINQRPVENKILNTAILEGYHTAMPKGRYPIGCLFIEMDPSEIDINIHPAKKEVKFQKERAVRTVVSEALREALLEFATESDETLKQDEKPQILDPEITEPTQGNQSKKPEIPKPDLSVIQRAYQENFLPTELEEQSEFEKEPINPNATNSESISPTDKETQNQQIEKTKSSCQNENISQTTGINFEGAEATLKVPLKIIGMVGSHYILLESERGLVLMDQRAARSRIIYERLLASLTKDATHSQRLLLPETFEIPLKDASILKENLENLNNLGIEIREFGEKSFVLEALPPVLKTPDARKFAVELIDRIRLGGTGKHSWDFETEALAKQMAFQAVSQNSKIDDSEVHLIVRDLRYCKMPYTAPDGRPTLLEFSFSELDRKFGLK